MSMTPNEYRLNGIEHWVRYWRRRAEWYGETLAVPYMPHFIPTIPSKLDILEPPITFRYRRIIERFRTPKSDYTIINIEMLLQDGKTWEVIEKYVDNA